MIHQIVSYLNFIESQCKFCRLDALLINFSRSLCYDTVSYYDTYLLINYCATSDFCLHGMHDTAYDSFIVASVTYFNYFS
jgi:hypothetical protein